MRKKYILFFVIMSVFGLLSYFIYGIVVKVGEKNTIAQQLKTVPVFELLTVNQKVFTNRNLKPNLYTVFLYFNSECEFCQHEAQSISENLNQFKDVQILFVSTESLGAVQQFSEHYNLHNKQNITFLQDKDGLFNTLFDATTIPYILIYDKNQKLIKKHKGQLNANGILRALHGDG
ncbi:peroxiredoxin family protein [Flagellimonas crocea]|uniref:peroxiredoxin family protein n=1 Tax=Flagellimonas crocea TaxID=3067311 RepID=UPI00296EEC9B|nr:redoxin domain-containing protein [Muricauda sp. DH64]